MDIIETLCIYEAFMEVTEDENRRKYWVNPLNSERLMRGQFHVLYERLCANPNIFEKYYHMPLHVFQELLHVVKPFITKSDTNMRLAITPEERLIITLKYLAKGVDLNTISEDFLIGRSTASNIIKETCIQIWTILQPHEMPEPNESTWYSNAEIFNKKTNFPNCVGAADGKHVRIKSPSHSGSNYYNYKKFFSIVLMAVVDANCCFTMINVGDYGKESENAIFRKSALGQKLYKNELNLPEGRPLPNYNESPQPFVLVADEAFGLHRNMMRPYPSRNLDRSKRIFNYRLSRARRCVECAFGILTNKWRVFHSPIQVNADYAIHIVKATCILHNFVRRRVGANYDEEFLNCPLRSTGRLSTRRRPLNSATTTRDFFRNYFVGAGALPWQDRINSVF